MTDCCENGKPKDCQYCYYYGRHGCMLKVCYYARPKPETKPVSECDDCPYDPAEKPLIQRPQDNKRQRKADAD